MTEQPRRHQVRPLERAIRSAMADAEQDHLTARLLVVCSDAAVAPAACSGLKRATTKGLVPSAEELAQDCR